MKNKRTEKKRRQDASTLSAKRSQRLYEVAVAGISAALAFLFLALSMLVKYGTIAFFFAAALSVMVPLTKKYYFASVAAYVVASLLCLAMPYDIMQAMGFIFYFGPMSIASAIMYDQKLKWYISEPIKAVYMCGSTAFMYYVAGTIYINEVVIGQVPFWAVALVGTIALLVLDVAMLYLYKNLRVLVGKVLRDKRYGLGVKKSDGNGTNEGANNSANNGEIGGGNGGDGGDDESSPFGADYDEPSQNATDKNSVDSCQDATRQGGKTDGKKGSHKDE